MSILTVEVGDRFSSVFMKTGVEVIKIWFEFNASNNRWETSVTWVEEPKAGDSYQNSSKGCEFIQKMRDGGFERANDNKTISFNVTPTAKVSSPVLGGTTATLSADPKRVQWEQDFQYHASRWGMVPSDLGRKIRLGGSRKRDYTIVGAKPRNYKMPILIQGRRGGVYKITIEKAKAGLV